MAQDFRHRKMLFAIGRYNQPNMNRYGRDCGVGQRELVSPLAPVVAKSARAFGNFTTLPGLCRKWRNTWALGGKPGRRIAHQIANR